ncbi:DUF2284 domain-containing protein [Methanoculleus chikugoensis]|uniref:DUF2284 domain-containing protein n=1 Tax=Methanoculleus chikugoensis TaxID=118126 RepID=UPI001FB35168|nr:DUF2284 domain-containing protein [Methanoculleus chikugoensis]
MQGLWKTHVLPAVCPPTPPAETGRLLGEYGTALLLRFEGIPGHPDLKPDEIPLDFHPFFRDLILWVNSTVHLLEKTAFYDDFPKAFGFGGYPCIYCEHLHCVAEEHEGGVVDESIRRLCRHMDLVRPTMEGAGIDVFSTARKVGWNLHVVPCRDLEYGKIEHGNITSVGSSSSSDAPAFSRPGRPDELLGHVPGVVVPELHRGGAS